MWFVVCSLWAVYKWAVLLNVVCGLFSVGCVQVGSPAEYWMTPVLCGLCTGGSPAEC